MPRPAGNMRRQRGVEFSWSSFAPPLCSLIECRTDCLSGDISGKPVLQRACAPKTFLFLFLNLDEERPHISKMLLRMCDRWIDQHIPNLAISYLGCSIFKGEFRFPGLLDVNNHRGVGVHANLVAFLGCKFDYANLAGLLQYLTVLRRNRTNICCKCIRRCH